MILATGPGTYLQAGYWVAQHGGLPISQRRPPSAEPTRAWSFASTGFLSRGQLAVPGGDAGHADAAQRPGSGPMASPARQAVGPFLGGLAALSLRGLVARLVGPQWAPAGALLLGVSLPQQYISRSTLSETALQVVLFGGLCMLADSLLLRAQPAPASPLPPPDPAPGAQRGGAQRAGGHGSI